MTPAATLEEGLGAASEAPVEGRAEPAPDRAAARPPEERGATIVRLRVVEQIASGAARGIPGVRGVSGPSLLERSDRPPHLRAEASAGADDAVAVRLAVSLPLEGPSVPARVDALRATVRDAVERLVGCSVERVDVDVLELRPRRTRRLR